MASRHVDAVHDGDYGNRRLVVVAVFDVVGFSAAVEADEENALAAWRALRRHIDPLLAQGGGRIFKSLGDGLMVEFTSPVDATRTALQVQQAAAKLEPVRDVRFEMRCAIHMGDVIVEDEDLMGDGINVAARLQEHAPIGGVLVSSAVLDLISGRIDAPVEDLGTLQLKNIRRPVHAYVVGAAVGRPLAGRGLDGERGPRRLDRAGELDQQPVAQRLEDAAAALGDQRIDGAAQRPPRRQHARLVGLDQGAEIHHVESGDHDQPPLGGVLLVACRRGAIAGHGQILRASKIGRIGQDAGGAERRRARPGTARRGGRERAGCGRRWGAGAPALCAQSHSHVRDQTCPVEVTGGFSTAAAGCPPPRTPSHDRRRKRGRWTKGRGN